MLCGVSCKAECSVIQVMQKSNGNQDESGLKNKWESSLLGKKNWYTISHIQILSLVLSTFADTILLPLLLFFIHLSEAKKE